MWDQKSVETKYAMILRLHVTNPVTIGFISKVNRASRIKTCMCSSGVCVFLLDTTILFADYKEGKIEGNCRQLSLLALVSTITIKIAPNNPNTQILYEYQHFVRGQDPGRLPAAAAFTKTLNNLNYICVHSVQHNQNEQQRTARKMSPRMQNLCYELLMPPRKQNLRYELLIFSA